MAFKMRSGNKVSFKNMGGSPAKQDDDTRLVNPDETQASIDARKRQDEINKQLYEDMLANTSNAPESSSVKSPSENT